MLLGPFLKCMQAGTCRNGTAHVMVRVCLCDDSHPVMITRGVMTVNTTLLDRTASVGGTVGVLSGFAWLLLGTARIHIFRYDPSSDSDPTHGPHSPPQAKDLRISLSTSTVLPLPSCTKPRPHTPSTPFPIRLISTDKMGFTDFVSETGLHVLNSWVRTKLNTTSGTLD